LPETERRERELTSLADSGPSVVRDAMVLERFNQDCNFKDSRLGSKIRANLESKLYLRQTIRNIKRFGQIYLAGRFEFLDPFVKHPNVKMTKKSLGGEE
jgi:hypothetical protein